jgi:OOP family OmpA-OmpF porin
MKKSLVVALAGMSLAFAGYAEAAKPKKRSRSANRIGAYGGAQIAQNTYSANGAEAIAADLEDTLNDAGVGSQNLTSGVEDTDIGYQAMFGYRFHRYVAAELGLAQFGSMDVTASADVDFDDGEGFVPTKLKVSHMVGGPMFSVVGILPLGDRFELFGRVGYIFASTRQEFSASIDGQNAGGGSVKGESQDLAYGVGFSFHINQVYSIRGEYQQIDGVGQPSRTGQEDLKVFGLGVIVRF